MIHPRMHSRYKVVRPILLVGLVSLVGFGIIRYDGNTSSPAPFSTTCVLGATGADVEVQFTHDTTPCATQEQILAVTGLSWYPLGGLVKAGSPGPADGETEQNVCTLSEGYAVLTVMDAGGMDYGQQICSGDEQGGWTNTND